MTKETTFRKSNSADTTVNNDYNDLVTTITPGTVSPPMPYAWYRKTSMSTSDGLQQLPIATISSIPQSQGVVGKDLAGLQQRYRLRQLAKTKGLHQSSNSLCAGTASRSKNAHHVSFSMTDSFDSPISPPSSDSSLVHSPSAPNAALQKHHSLQHQPHSLPHQTLLSGFYSLHVSGGSKVGWTCVCVRSARVSMPTRPCHIILEVILLRYMDNGSP